MSNVDSFGWRYYGQQRPAFAIAPGPGEESVWTIRGWISFYPGRIDCYVGGVKVMPQPGGFYGGWITPEVVGPFKGAPGSSGW